MKHPLPWTACRERRNYADYFYHAWCVVDADGAEVQHFQINEDYPEEAARELAGRIAGAVNSRADLLAALKLLLHNACRPGDDGKYDDLYDDARTAAYAAVAKAEA